MGHEHRHHPPVAEGEIRVVVHLLGMLGGGHHEPQPAGIGREDIATPQRESMRLALGHPVGMHLQEGLHGLRADQVLGHG